MPARYQTIANFAVANNWRVGVELGVLDGRTFLYLVQHCLELQMHGVDVWDPDYVEPGMSSGERCFCSYCNETRSSRRSKTVPEHEMFVRRRAERFGDRAVLHKMTSAQASLIIANDLDFVFIDANHSTEAVRADIRLWSPKIRSGGYLFGHDYNMHSVRQAVFDCFGGDHVERGDDHLWWIKSPLSVLNGDQNTPDIT
jgi:hypothetical protein